jgi:hypothetical protein
MKFGLKRVKIVQRDEIWANRAHEEYMCLGYSVAVGNTMIVLRGLPKSGPLGDIFICIELY